MGGVYIPFLPTSLWVIASALTILLLLVVLVYHIYWRKREAALLEDSEDAAALSAKKQILQADMEAIRQWLDDQKVELERLNTERDEQERLRALLADLEQQCATKDQENQSLRNEVGALENQKHLLAQTLEKIERDIEKFDIEVQKLESRKHEAEIVIGKLDRDLP
jgi:chromosome segregation ATPase